MKAIVRSVLGLGIVAVAAVAFYNVSWADKAGEACPAMGCPALQQIHADDPGAAGISPDERPGADGKGWENPHKSVTPGVCPYSGGAAVSEMNQA